MLKSLAQVLTVVGRLLSQISGDSDSYNTMHLDDVTLHGSVTRVSVQVSLFMKHPWYAGESGC